MMTSRTKPKTDELLNRPIRPRLWNVFVKRGIELQLVLWFATFLIFAAHGAMPTPDSNETNYIGKAKHFWDANWCKNDFFLNSADAHLLYYITFGWVTKFVSLTTAAWIGRITIWMGLAWAWQKISFAIFRRVEFGPIAAALFVLFNERFHMAGEWIIGGVEGKGFCYIFVWWAIAEMLRHRWQRVFVLLGIASAFHVIIGAWITLSALIVWTIAGRKHVGFTKILPSLLLGGLFALPSLWAGLQLTHGVDSEIIAQSNNIYVYERLPHHLLPQQFREGFIVRHLGLMAASFCFVGALIALTRTFRTRFVDPSSQVIVNGVEPIVAEPPPVDRQLSVTADSEIDANLKDRFSVLTLLISVFIAVALGGLVLSYALQDNPKLLAAMMRFYWFRESDAFVPMLAALAIMRVIEEMQPRFRVSAQLASLALCAIVVWDTSTHVRHWPFTIPGLHVANTVPRAETKRVGTSPDDSNSPLEFTPEDWREVCDWVKKKTPTDAMFLTPRIVETFKWRAERAELVIKKDLPQDAKSMVVWWSRLNDVHGNRNPAIDSKWQRTLADWGDQGLLEICKKYDVDYAIVHYREGMERLNLVPVFRNKSFDVFQIKADPQSENP